MQIRNSAKAIILKNEKLLVIQKKDDEGYYYILPGGGQEHGETLTEAVIRECMEETGEEVEAGELLFIREYIGKNHEHKAFDSRVHQIEYMFSCKLITEHPLLKQGSIPDEGQLGVEWLPLSTLFSYRLYPQSIRKKVIDYSKGIKSAVYLGDIN
ncbi:NUDIX domain-containing protein [Jeotgalibacillus sp. S-D1]|uniref:NUDIX domain-containing protein n=1 Tax=Jeotgalibacillus sp. S-D1 TaxID=2552189 RepID=UPI0010597368|nr:NUDIX domain-containing protein [Jeotgalibacillus sp. S-D1]TDL30875.1 NUDIX domain-containing protein [Jeotgalibacillus sp. S-D1]